MSISALLSTADEPATAPSSINARVSPASNRHRVAETHPHRNLESARPVVKPQSSSRPIASGYQPMYDADATDSEHEPVYVPSANKSVFRDFKYHDSMNIDRQGLDATESDNDSDEFMSERIEYMKRARKRQMGVEEREAHKRKVCAVFFFFFSIHGPAQFNRQFSASTYQTPKEIGKRLGQMCQNWP
jgi:hypothetical protein